MAGLRKVIWAEGVLLAQQHFQQWDKCRAYQDKLNTRGLLPFHWGISALVLDESGLANGQLSVKRLQALLPDGRWVDFDAALEGEPLHITLDSSMGKTVDIYLALTVSERVEGINGYPALKQGSASWQTEYVSVTDCYDSARTNEVMLGRQQLVLLTGLDSKNGYTTIHLTSLRCVGSGAYQRDKTHIPPIISLAASTEAASVVQRMIERIHAKLTILQNRRSQYGHGVSEFGHNDVVHFALLQLLSTELADFQRLKNNVFAHPQELHAAMSRLRGGLAPFTLHPNWDGAVSYLHDNLTQTFLALETKLSELLNEALPAGIQAVKLSYESDGLSAAEAIDSQLLKQAQFYIAVKHEADKPDWVNLFEQQTKVASKSKIYEVIAKALSGVSLRYLAQTPSNLAVRSGFAYFQIVQTGHYWQQLVSEQSLAVFVSQMFQQAQIDLVMTENN